MQGLPEQHTDGLLSCLLIGLQVEGLMHLLSPPVVDSCHQGYELPSTVSCACVWSEWAPPASVASESFQDRRQISTWQNHWPWSESKPNQDSTQSVAELRHQVERKWGRATNLIFVLFKPTHALHWVHCLWAFRQGTCKRYDMEKLVEQTTVPAPVIGPHWYLSSISSTIHSRFPSFSTSHAIVCLPAGLRLRTLSCLTLSWLRSLQLPFHCY